jgi:ABC-type multidrug transport system fused ATPase/permease subunit
MVNEGLEQALGMQLQVAVRRWALITAADVQMRISSVINYLVIAVAVFAASDSGWVWGASLSMQDLDGPHLTAAISRASFYSLAICQGWSDLVKASIQLGDIRGYANRVRQLLLLVSHNDGRDEGTEERNAGAPGQVLDTAHLPLAALRSRHAIGRGQVVRAPAPRQAQRSAGALDAPAPAPDAATLAVRVGGADASDMHQRSVGQCNEIAFCDVCVWSPSGDMLVDKLSLVLRQGERLLISGPNGCGKRALISLHHSLETFLYLYF